MQEKHAKEKAELELRIQRWKKVNDETAKELFDALHRGDRLARSVGFESLYKAQIYLDSFDHSATFKEYVDRTRTLEAELICEKKEVEILQAKLNKVGDESKIQDELKKMKAELRSVIQPGKKKTSELIQISSNSERRHQEELRQLQERYDSLKVMKERAAERYKADYKKWRAFSKWLFAENDKHHKHRNEPGISEEEKRRRDVESVMRRRQKMIEIGPDLARFEGEDGDPEGLDISPWSGFVLPNTSFLHSSDRVPPASAYRLYRAGCR
jgi:vacuolar-type H+-ATPase subunit I/STV1